MFVCGTSFATELCAVARRTAVLAKIARDQTPFVVAQHAARFFVMCRARDFPLKLALVCGTSFATELCAVTRRTAVLAKIARDQAPFVVAQHAARFS